MLYVYIILPIKIMGILFYTTYRAYQQLLQLQVHQDQQQWTHAHTKLCHSRKVLGKIKLF